MSDELRSLMESARASGGLEFIFTLTRVEGMSLNTPDPLHEARTGTVGCIELSEGARTELLKILANLFRCAAGERYTAFAETDGPAQHQAMAAAAREAGKPEIVAVLEAGGSELDELLWDLLESYDRERHAVGASRRIHKLPDFTVLELLTDETGLTGFRAYFSNDGYAEFVRTEDSTMPLNLSFDEDGGVVFFVGDTSALVNEWRIGGRPLYEVGLEGRYNAPGEWRPLVYPADWDEYARRATAESERPEVQGALLYIFLTGHHAVEFAARTSVELPHEVITFGGGRLELFKVSPPVGGQIVYDGTAYVAAPEADHIEEALRDVQALVNRIAFSFDSAVRWVPKYSTVQSGGSHATPSDDDLQLLDRLLGAGGDTGRRVVDEAIDWYNRGRSAANEFVAFLCSYISFESTALAVWNGDLDSPVALSRPAKAARKADTLRCVEALHELEYDQDPVRFVSNAYFDCVVGVRSRVEQVAKAVFGENSPLTQLLFEERDGTSLSGIRGALAHGRLSLTDHDARELVRMRLPEVRDVAHEFLLRVALRLAPADQVPEWSRLHNLQIAMTDPRATLCTSSLQHLPLSDWRIRAEWID